MIKGGGMQERRIKRLYVGEELAFSAIVLRTMDVSVIHDADYPEDVKFERCTYDFERRSFCFLISHPSFPEVNDGEMPRMVTPLYKREYAKPVVAS